MKRTLGEKIFEVFNIILILMLCIVMLYPYLNQMAVAFSSPEQAIRGGITIFPKSITIKNFTTVLRNKEVWSSLAVSTLRVVIGTFLGLFVTSIAAYSLSKKKLPGRKLIATFLLVPTFISGGIIPYFILYRNIGLLNNFLVYVLPGCFGFFNMLIMREFFNTIPSSLEEAAVIDGANQFQVFHKIYLPLSKPVLATVGLWLGVGAWNDWITNLYFVTKPSLSTIQYVLIKIIKETEAVQRMIAEESMRGVASSRYVPTPLSLQAAVVIIATIPIISVYPFLQKYFVKGVTLGSVKE